MGFVDRRIVYAVIVALLLTIAAGVASLLDASSGDSPRAVFCAGNRYLFNGREVCVNIDPL